LNKKRIDYSKEYGLIINWTKKELIIQKNMDDYSKEYGLIINWTKKELIGWRDYIKRKQKSEEPEPKPEDAKKFISAISERINLIRQTLEMRKKHGKWF